MDDIILQVIKKDQSTNECHVLKSLEIILNACAIQKEGPQYVTICRGYDLDTTLALDTYQKATHAKHGILIASICFYTS